MDEIEKRARELLAIEYEKLGCTDEAGDIREQCECADSQMVLKAIIAALLAAKQGVSPALRVAAHEALPFIAYAHSQGVVGAEEAGRAIESALAAKPEPAK